MYTLYLAEVHHIHDSCKLIYTTYLYHISHEHHIHIFSSYTPYYDSCKLIYTIYTIDYTEDIQF